MTERLKESYKPVAVAVRLRSTPYVVTCNIFVLFVRGRPRPQFKGAYFSANLFTVDSRRVVPAR